MRIVKPSAVFISSTPGADLTIESAGRTCYKSEDRITQDSAEKFIKMIIARGHESVLEHAYASFRIVCDRGVSHEIVRHRIASYSQESTRYCNYGSEKHDNQITVIEPPGLQQCSDPLVHNCIRGDLTCCPWHNWAAAMQRAEDSYLAMVIHQGVHPQIARSVLPNSLKTEIVMTANFREWRHFIKLRTSKAAHPQMREIAEKIRDVLVVLSSACFGDLKGS